MRGCDSDRLARLRFSGARLRRSHWMSKLLTWITASTEVYNGRRWQRKEATANARFKILEVKIRSLASGVGVEACRWMTTEGDG